MKKIDSNMSPLQLETSSILATAYTMFLYAMLLFIAFLLTKLPVVAGNITIGQNRHGSLDGLRGLLAVGVFIWHSFTAYRYFVTDKWDWSSSAILNHLGQTTVALFFMITGFLFALKALSPKINWLAFYFSRLARLLPLYAIVVSATFIVVFWLSQGVLHESILTILKEFLLWISFVCFDRPDINKFPMSWTLIAGVNWSLKYEVLFYIFAVPAMHLAAKIVSPRILLFFSSGILAILLVARWYKGYGGGDILYTTHFLCGVVAAYMYKEPHFLQLMKKELFQIIASLSVLSLVFFPTAYGVPAIIISTAFFTALLGGFSMGGLLNLPAMLWLGDISYGIYLIHGLVLWLTLFTVKSFSSLVKMSVMEYGLLMVLVGAVTIFLASLSYVLLEKPSMMLARNWSKKNNSAHI
jgi:peptidoglycan/LPS O-acetylase OafA/YrhL